MPLSERDQFANEYPVIAAAFAMPNVSNAPRRRLNLALKQLMELLFAAALRLA